MPDYVVESASERNTTSGVGEKCYRQQQAAEETDSREDVEESVFTESSVNCTGSHSPEVAYTLLVGALYFQLYLLEYRNCRRTRAVH